jgi:2-keto-4-pentenoate hydratase/2-oxohepta-3-ene-1,7-dioic acid hydratase in catechol pathway
VTTAVLRTSDGWWAETGGGAVRIETAATTTHDLLTDRTAITAAAAADGVRAVPVSSLQLLSPVTTPCRVVALMANYRSHARDAGFDPDTLPTTFFRKSSGSITQPYGDIVKPAHVNFLDYEVEIGLVIGADIAVNADLNAASADQFIAGLVLANDVSARDVQLPKTQFYESKSYPTFTPLGPRLVLLDAGELARFAELRLRLWVNGALRQDARAADMIARPMKALRVLSGFQAMQPGDVLLSGTPGGTALKAPPKMLALIGSLVPPPTRWKAFFARQARNPAYLKDGDVVEAWIGTDDGAIDLGRQRMVVRDAKQTHSSPADSSP